MSVPEELNVLLTSGGLGILGVPLEKLERVR